MTEILVFEPSLERIRDALAHREVEPVVWRADGTLHRAGVEVQTNEIAPRAGWISFDVFAAGQLAPFVDLLTSQPSLEWVQTGHAGLDNPIYRRLAEQAVRVSKSWAQSIPIAEYVLAHVLEHFQGLGARAEAQAQGQWRNLPFRELYAKRWLIIGFGHIGRRVALRARAFESHITAMRHSSTPDAAADVLITPDQLEGTLAQADVVVLACPQTEATTGMVDARFIDAMKPGAVLVNVARGGLIDDEALLAGLDRGTPGQAILDVFHAEPLPTTHAFWGHERVRVTAHMSNAGDGTLARGAEQFLGNLDAFLAGAPVGDEVSRQTLLAIPG